VKKILYIVDSLQIGGTEISILEICSRFREFTPVICFVYQNDTLRPSFERAGIKVIGLNTRGRYNFYRAGRAFSKVLKEESPDLVVASLVRSELISRVVCRFHKIPNIGTFVSNPYSREAWNSLSMSGRLKKSFFWFLDMLSARFAAAFISNSESVRRSNAKALMIPLSKIHVIYRGRSLDVFRYKKHELKPVKKILTVGRLVPNKGYEELFKAFSRFSRKHPDITLTIAGDGPMRGRLEKFIDQHRLSGLVSLIGSTSDVAALMNSHDVFVFPSHYEGFSGSVVEAMLAGIPIILSDISANHEAIQQNYTGRFFAVQDYESLEVELEWAVRNYAQMLSFTANARAVAEHKFNIFTVVNQYEEFFRQLIFLHQK
jgi:glycosyltransferase involved in cell wall biosynthesis